MRLLARRMDSNNRQTDSRRGSPPPVRGRGHDISRASPVSSFFYAAKGGLASYRFFIYSFSLSFLRSPGASACLSACLPAKRRINTGLALALALPLDTQSRCGRVLLGPSLVCALSQAPLPACLPASSACQTQSQRGCKKKKGDPSAEEPPPPPHRRCPTEPNP